MRISDWSSDVCSSDLDQGRPVPPFPEQAGARRGRAGRSVREARRGARRYHRGRSAAIWPVYARLCNIDLRSSARAVALRSEEHTSELQSLMRISYAVFCLKKKKKNIKNNTQYGRKNYFTTQLIQK